MLEGVSQSYSRNSIEFNVERACLTPLVCPFGVPFLFCTGPPNGLGYLFLYYAAQRSLHSAPVMGGALLV